jgi:hypothetical protein
MVSNDLIKSKERVSEFGEVFTPEHLVEKMLDMLPEDAWDKSKLWLEPTCGTGNFVVAIIKRKLSKGFTPLEAVNTTYGMDIMPDNIAECRKRIVVDILKKEFSKNGRLPASRKQEYITCIVAVENNIRVTPDSLSEDWETGWLSIDELPEEELSNRMQLIKERLKIK